MLIDFVNRASIFLLSLSEDLAEEPQLNAAEQKPAVMDCNLLLPSDGSFWSLSDRDFKGLEFDPADVIWFGFMTVVLFFLFS